MCPTVDEFVGLRFASRVIDFNACKGDCPGGLLEFSATCPGTSSGAAGRRLSRQSTCRRAPCRPGSTGTLSPLGWYNQAGGIQRTRLSRPRSSTARPRRAQARKSGRGNALQSTVPNPRRWNAVLVGGTHTTRGDSRLVRARSSGSHVPLGHCCVAKPLAAESTAVLKLRKWCSVCYTPDIGVEEKIRVIIVGI